jgi:hypothetical protein
MKFGPEMGQCYILKKGKSKESKKNEGIEGK